MYFEGFTDAELIWAFILAFSTLVAFLAFFDVFEHAPRKPSLAPKNPHAFNIHDPWDVDVFRAGFAIFTPHTEL